MIDELAKARWFKSSRSSGGRECVEVAHLGNGMVGVRDSKKQSGPALVFTPGEWDAFTANLIDGSLDRM
ncbi:DUF397 domain-containing protein [Nocardia terpenica]|uniref:DUF397 domain-containing protein n=1 Tax=Nocardia terpenica TaxID=455432 RepID=A0A164LQ34_9NOCA|nr:DUF397 domain-containing protein [Nocardia terpenica]KZM72647.1 DUF397 domain-containing protein [Nocardia terpenica]NQE92461.1 DUF397 domain-containing protein [Nocardia terpenica]